MLKVEDCEAIRRAYFIEGKSIRAIARAFCHGRPAVRAAIARAEPSGYRLKEPRACPVLGPYKARIDALLEENETLPRKQRYTGARIFAVLQAEGYTGSASHVRSYLAQRRRQHKKPQVFLPLAFDPGVDAQVDWGEGAVIFSGRQVTVQLFFMRLCYSRRLFMMAFPSQKQEAFFYGHVKAFAHFGGVPHRISYDNLKTAVLHILSGRNRQEQQAFILFRSHYLFESHFCTPGAAHEKGGVEHGVGFGRRNFLVPLPEVDSFKQLNDHLLAQCRQDDLRTVHGQDRTIGQAFEKESPHLRPLPAHPFDCCVIRPVSLTPYSQVTFETNRYSVPTDTVYTNLVLKAYPFHVDIVHLDGRVASHKRCYQKDQDIFDPVHYLPLLERRPGAFAYAKPMRQWRTTWPPVYERLLCHLKDRWPGSRGIRAFIAVLSLHRDYPPDVMAKAIAQALSYGCAHADGVKLCCHQLLHPERAVRTLCLLHKPHLQAVAGAPADLSVYDHLLERGR